MTRLKNIPKYLLILIILMSCDVMDDSEMDYRLDLPDNELVFELIASVTPMVGTISPTDTLWLSIHVNDPILKDKVSKQDIKLPLDQSIFTIQLEVQDLIENKRAHIQYFAKNGRIVRKPNDIATSNKLAIPNVITAQFGHPDTIPTLDLGFVFGNVGRYALILHNYPNPFLDDKNEICDDDCDEIWYDLTFYDSAAHTETYNAFVDYRFGTSDFLAADSPLKEYTNISTYTNAIYPITVR